MIVVNSILHLIIDAICVYSLYGFYGKESASAFIIFIMCAYALRMPFGAVIDLVIHKMKGLSEYAVKRFFWLVSMLGVVVILTGMYSGPIALGVGSALFHAGAGVDTIKETASGRMKGIRLGIFFAAGIPGFLAGKILADFTSITTEIRSAFIFLCALLALSGFLRRQYEMRHCSFVVVDDKEGSAVKSSVNFEKGRKTDAVSTIAAIVGSVSALFLCSYAETIVKNDLENSFLFSLLALLLFNIAVTTGVYILISAFKALTGVAFGLPAFGAAAGYLLAVILPKPAVPEKWLGLAGCVISVVILAITIIIGEKRGKNIRKNSTIYQ